ncbi:MAG: type II toxin-antitoxin system RelE/ParE family toxin [Verrucomicrobiota bacterium]
MKIELVEAAEAELTEAIAYYEDIEFGLGLRLKDEIRKAIAWIQSHPELPSLRAKGYRRINLNVFPYYVAYIIWKDTVWIVAIAHSYRLPEYWIKRKRGWI